MSNRRKIKSKAKLKKALSRKLRRALLEEQRALSRSMVRQAEWLRETEGG